MNEKREAEGRAAWRASVNAFRAAAAALDRPAPYAMSLLSEVAAVASLSAEPPITNFSPFEALPPGDYAARAETSEGEDGRVRGRAAKYVEATRGVETARVALDSQPSRPASVRREQTTPASESSEGSDAFPVFSLKPPRAVRTKPADVSPLARRESSSLDARRNEARTTRAEALETRRAVVGPRETAAAVPNTSATGESASYGEPLTLPSVLRTKPPRAEGESEGRAEQHVRYPTALPLLNELADETLRALKLREGEAGRAANPSAAVPSELVRRRPAEIQPQSRTTTRRAEALTPATRAEVRAREASPSPPRTLAPLKPDGERPAELVGNSIEAINALAELLSARTAVPMTERRESERREAADDEGVASHGVPPVEEALRSHAYLNAAKPARVVEAVAPRDASGPSLNAEGEVGPAQALDAESVASLVNDVLVEQARRHGVDLS